RLSRRRTARVPARFFHDGAGDTAAAGGAGRARRGRADPGGLAQMARPQGLRDAGVIMAKEPRAASRSPQTLTPDICVIGAGSGGLSVAAAAAAFGVPVVLVEKGKMGGDCLNYGC